MMGMNDSMKGMDMKKLGSLTGNDLDLEFIKQMIPHHQGAVVMANEAVQKSQKNEIKTLANGIIKAQNAEIKQMQDWQTGSENRLPRRGECQPSRSSRNPRRSIRIATDSAPHFRAKPKWRLRAR